MKIQVGVIFGGASVEHEISILTAMQVLEHIDQDKYEAIPIYCAKDQTLYHDPCLCDLGSYKDLRGLVKKLSPITLYHKAGTCYLHYLKRWKSKRRLDFIIPIFHGTNGEDGTIQGFLKMLQVPHSGSSVIGATIGQDKVIMKELLAYHKIPICPWFMVDRFHYEPVSCRRQCDHIGWPVIIKPANLGSSVGIHVVHSENELDLAIQNAFLYDTKVVIEKVITNMREFNCSVLGDEEETQISSIEEVLKEDTILSYQDKYERGSKNKGIQNTSRVLPAKLEEDQKSKIEQLALQTFQILQASGVVRIDFIMDVDHDIIYVNEINTIPGSLSCYLWDAKGVSFMTLIDRMIALGIKKQRLQEQMIFSYTSNVLSSYQGGNKRLK